MNSSCNSPLFFISCGFWDLRVHLQKLTRDELQDSVSTRHRFVSGVVGQLVVLEGLVRRCGGKVVMCNMIPCPMDLDYHISPFGSLRRKYACATFQLLDSKFVAFNVTAKVKGPNIRGYCQKSGRRRRYRDTSLQCCDLNSYRDDNVIPTEEVQSQMMDKIIKLMNKY